VGAVAGTVSAGDYVLADDGAPVGRVESVLRSASGDRLLIARAFSRGGYLNAPVSEIGRSEDDPKLGLRWHSLCVPVQTLLSRGIFKRVMGRLVPDAYPSAFGSPRDDAEARADVLAALANEPLTREIGLNVHVRHGVAILEGIIGTVGGKVVAERIARVTPGVWDAVNRIVADEELSGAIRARLRLDGRLAAAIRDVSVKQGEITLDLLPHAQADEVLRRDLIDAIQATAGVRRTILH
jgi:hypothetical protein